MSQIPDFTETERWTLRTALTECSGALVDVQPADGEVRSNPESSALTTRPVACWSWPVASLAPAGITTTIRVTASPSYCRSRRTTKARKI